MSLYRRPDSPFWHYDVTVNGRRFRGSTGEVSREAAKLAEADRRRAHTAEVARGDRRLTLNAAAARYWAEHAHRLPSAATLDLWVRTLLAGLGKETPLEALTDDQLATYVARRRATVANATVNRELATLRAIVRMARDRWGAPVPGLNWRAHWQREAAPRARYLTTDEAARLLAAAAPHLRPAIELSLLTGIRLSNCIGLDWAEVDLDARTLRLARVKSMHDGGRGHTVPLCAPAVVLLANLAPEPARGHDPRDKRRGRVFLLKGKPLKTWRTAWRAAKRRAGVDDFRWHDLRHTAASWMVQAGVPLEVVRRILGHADIATTLRYAHHADDAARQAVAQLGQAIAGVSISAPSNEAEKRDTAPGETAAPRHETTSRRAGDAA
ncbi:MAG: tyrosine-type recombinase/integrase [Rhodospirillaceae bacterium]